MNGNSVAVYSIAKCGNVKLSANFRVKEFYCHDGSDTVFISRELVNILQKVRDHFKLPVTINSGYRTEAWNIRQNGVTYSQHKYGMAADITIKGITPATIAAYVETLLPNSGGIGIYAKSGFVHVDVRETKSRWKEST